MTAGVIINPKSAKKGRKGRELIRALEGRSGVHCAVLKDFGELPEVLKDFAKRKIELIAISGGDGTVQAIQTLLAEDKPFRQLPRLAILPHGTTNMTAADLGLRIRNPDRIADMLDRPGHLRRATAIRKRRTVKVANLNGRSPQHGMFFGTGAIYQAVVLCQHDVHGVGLKGDLATGATLLVSLARALFSRSDPAEDPNKIDRGHPMTIRADGEVKSAFEQLLFLVTTLEKLILGTRPFWRDGAAGTLKATAVAYPHPPILRYLWKVMYGAPDRDLPEPDFLSFSGERIGLVTNTNLVIDGEFFEPPHDGEIELTAGPEFEYLCG